MEFEIEYFDEQDNCLTFYVTVTDYVNVAPQGKWEDVNKNAVRLIS